MAATASIGTRDGLVGMLGVLDLLESDRTGLGAAERLECVRLARRLADRAATLAAVLTAEADAAGASEQATGTAMTSWLTLDGKASKREAAGALKQGRALIAHPTVAQAAAGGGIGAGQARAITKVLDGLAPQLDQAQQHAAEQLMVDLASHLDPDGLTHAAPQVLAKVAPTAAGDLLESKLQREAEQAHRERALRFHEAGGSIRFDGSLPKPVGRAWMGLLDSYLHATRRTTLEQRDRLAEPVTFEQRRADALALLIRQHQQLAGIGHRRQNRRDPDIRAAGPGEANSQQPRLLAPDTGGTDSRGPDSREPHRQLAGHDRIVVTMPSRSDAERGSAGSGLADRARIFVVVDHDKLAARAAAAGLLNGAEPLSAGDLRRLCCDAGILPVVMGGESAILDLGRERRLVSPDLRAALELRDRGCVMPGCDVGPVGCEAHHIRSWAMGGITALHNLVLLCVQHHPKFEPAKNPLRQPWRIQIATDGVPEVIPPPFARLGEDPIRHQRFRSPPARAG